MNAEKHGLILFDGVCVLCSWTVQWIIRRDRAGYFRFAPLQSETAQKLIREHAAAGQDIRTDPRQTNRPDSIILLEGGRLFTESTAALRIARRLDGPWKLAAALLIVPKSVRDAAYRWVARNRYRWFGRRDRCMIPSPGIRDRFLSVDDL
jgi:predicted DCC family thiol-disulfide oxidoreductase YuxK